MGSWPAEKVDEIRDLIKARVSNGDPSRKEDIEVHRGIVEDVSDDKMWMALLVVAKDLLETKPALPAVSSPKFVTKLVVSSSEKPIGEPDTRPERSALSRISFLSNKKRIEMRVTADLATRFNRAMGNIHSTRGDMEKVFQEVKAPTEHLPDMPEKFISPNEDTEESVETTAGFWQRIRKA